MTHPDTAAGITAVVIAMTDQERPYAREAMASVLQQTVRPGVLRVYVEQHNAWIDAMLQGLPGFEVRRHPLRPLAEMRNLAARDAATPWLAFLDGDDLWERGKLERQLAAAQDGAALVGCDYYLTDTAGRQRVAALCRHIPPPSTWLVRHQLLLDHPFDAAWRYEDSAWWQHHRAWTFTARVPELLSVYRVRSGSLSSGTPGKRRKLQVLHWAGLPGVGGLVRAGTAALHAAWCAPARRRCMRPAVRPPIPPWRRPGGRRVHEPAGPPQGRIPEAPGRRYTSERAGPLPSAHPGAHRAEGTPVNAHQPPPAAGAGELSLDVTAVVLAMTDADRPYVREALASVLAQTRPPAAVRVYVEHRNTWIDGIVRKLPGVQVRRIDLMPPGHVRNLGAREAATEWIAYLDGDDLWHPRKQERQLPAAQRGALLIGCDYHLVDARGRYRTAALCRHIPSASTWLVRRELMLGCPFLLQWNRHSDSAWWEHYRAWEFTTRVPEMLSAYRVRSHSLSNGTPGKRRKQAVLRWAALPVLGPLVRLGAQLLHALFRARTYPVPMAWR